MVLLSTEEFLERLDKHVIEVNFNKANGDKRTMKCTLAGDFVPPRDRPESAKHSNERMVVWDVEKNGWRSFRLDSVNYVLTPDEEIS